MAADIPVTGGEIANLGPQVFREVVAAKQGERSRILADILTEIIQIVGNGPATANPGIPVVNRFSLCACARQCQCNPHRFYSYVHRVSSSMFGVVRLPAGQTPHLCIGDGLFLTTKEVWGRHAVNHGARREEEGGNRGLQGGRISGKKKEARWPPCYVGLKDYCCTCCTPVTRTSTRRSGARQEIS